MHLKTFIAAAVVALTAACTQAEQAEQAEQEAVSVPLDEAANATTAATDEAVK